MIKDKNDPTKILVEKYEYEKLLGCYEKLKEVERWLEALDAAGLDDWDGFEYAQKIFEE